MDCLKITGLVLWVMLSAGTAQVAKDPTASLPTVSYAQDFEGANPSHYEITVTRDGHGTYVSNGQLSRDAQPAELTPVAFEVSDVVRNQIFDLAKRTHYFEGKVDSGRTNIANTGTKTLSYRDEKHATKATYNYSENPSIEQETSIFQNLSTTLEFGRRLTFFRKYQKLALDDELKKMDDLRRDGMLGDVQAIAPILRDIAHDPRVMNVSRSRALRLLATIDLASGH